MANKTTFWARKLSFRQRHLLDNSTIGTGLACVRWINFYESPTACYSFVGQHLSEIIPRSIVYAFSENMIFQHRCDIELLNIDDSKIISYCPAELVQEVSTLVTDFQMFLPKIAPLT